MGFRVPNARQVYFGYGVGDNGPAPRYARFVEYGTSRMDMRPTLHSAIVASQRNIELHIQAAFRRAFAL
jgi:hypothetical protein